MLDFGLTWVWTRQGPLAGDLPLIDWLLFSPLEKSSWRTETTQRKKTSSNHQGSFDAVEDRASFQTSRLSVWCVGRREDAKNPPDGSTNGRFVINDCWVSYILARWLTRLGQKKSNLIIVIIVIPERALWKCRAIHSVCVRLLVRTFQCPCTAWSRRSRSGESITRVITKTLGQLYTIDFGLVIDCLLIFEFVL